MIIKIKSFIYRFFNIFGLRVYLAQKEEDSYIESLGDISNLTKRRSIGIWQIENGFCTVWTHGMPFHKAVYAKILNAFGY
jgi:hypothetical protein